MKNISQRIILAGLKRYFLVLVFVTVALLKLTVGIGNVFADGQWIAADTHGSLGNNQYNQNCAGRTYNLTMYGENSSSLGTYTGFRNFGLKFAWDSSSPTYGTYRSNYSAGTIGDTSTPNSPLPSGVSVSMSPVSGTYSYSYSSSGSNDTAIATLRVTFSASFNPAGPEFPSTGTQTAFYPILYVNNDPAFYPSRAWSSSQMYIYCNKPSAPPAPLNLTATAVSQSQINLSWNASTGATSYKVFRGGVQIATTSSTSYSNTGLTCNTAYSYTVKATNAAGDSANSNTASATTFACPPGAFSISVTRNSATQNYVSWGSASGAIGYDVFRDGVFIANTGLTTNYTDNSEFCNHQYNYQVRANGSGGTVTWNSNGAITTGPWACVPLPGSFTLTATTFSQTQIDLSWTASSNATNYEVYRGGVLITTISAVNPRVYSDTGRLCGTSYSYQVKATNASTPPTTDSNVENATTNACTPPYPGTVTLDSVTETCVNDSPAYDIAWSDTITSPNAPATNYIIEVTKVSTGQKFTQTVDGNVFNFSWSSVNQLAITPPGTTFNYAPEVSTNYSFAVTGVKTGFLSGVSGVLSDTSSASCSSCAVTPPVAFTNLAPADGSVAPYRLDFSWTNAWPSGNSGTSGYTLKVTPQGQPQLPDVTTTNTYLTWSQVFAVWSGQPFLAGNDFLPVGVRYDWVVVADNECTGVQTTSATFFTAQNLSAWLQTVGGSVESGENIELTFARPGGLYNATGSVVSDTTNVNFNSSSGWVSTNSGNTVNPETYNSLKTLFASRAVTTAVMMPNDGVYKITGNQTINSGFSVPNEPTVLIVEGDLTINSDINLPNETDSNAALILFVNGDLNVDESVTQIDAYMVVGGSFNSKAGVPSSSFSSQLNILGGLIYYTGANFGRIIDPSLNPGNINPAEKFIYDPRIVYLFNNENYLGVSRTTWQELAP